MPKYPELMLNAVVARACNLAKAKFGGVDSDDTEAEVANAELELHKLIMDYADEYNTGNYGEAG